MHLCTPFGYAAALMSRGRRGKKTHAPQGITGGPKTRQDIQALRIQTGLSVKKWEVVLALGRTLIRAAAVVACAAFVFLSVRALSGQKTSAIFGGFLDLRANEWAAWAIACLSAGAWGVEHSTRKKQLAKHSQYIKQIEKRIDASRSSSGLLDDGDPPEGD